MGKKIAIIGAGLAGLSAGIYLQKGGAQTEIFELADWAGGMCTAWTRKGYRFDGCIHWMVGTHPKDGFYSLYREVGALEEDTVIHNAKTIQYEIDGKMYEIPLELEPFTAFLHALSPEDKEEIDAFCRDIKVMMNTHMPSGMPENFKDILNAILHSRGFLSLARKYLGITVDEYVRRFKNPQLRSIFLHLMLGSFSAEGLVMMLGTRMGGNAGYPLGGASDVIARMEKKYRDLGGVIHFRSRVEEITVENSRAVGIKTGGEFHPFDGVIAACDAWDTLKHMLGGKYEHPQLDNMLESAPLFDPLALVSFGLSKTLDIPFMVSYECPDGIATSPETKEYGFALRSFDFDPSAAPEGCSSTMVMLGAPLEYWEELRKNDISEYKKQKQALADRVADAIDQRIPGFKDAIVVTDVATPATYTRLTNVYKGSFEGFGATPKALKTNIKKTLPGLGGFAICGQWTVAGGGLCTAVASGKSAARLMLKEAK